MNYLKFSILLLLAAILLFWGLFFDAKLRNALEDYRVSAVNLSAARGSYMKFRINEAVERNKEFNILFVGDVMLSRGVGGQIKKHGPRFPFLKIKNFLNPSDLVFGNLEGPISGKGEDMGSIYSFRAEPRVAEGLKFAGFDVMSLANNHIFDWGKEALVDTVEILNKNEIIPVGAGKNYAEANKPAIVRLGKNRIAFLAYTTLYPESLKAGKGIPGVSEFNELKIRSKIKNLKESADIVIVSLHWGEEYKNKANKRQRDIARAFIGAGADLIVGHHPHVPQELERYGKGWAAYSLGNFVFDQSFSKETMRGVVILATVKNGEIVRVKPVEIKINEFFQPYFAKEIKE